jgi:hypothetical protein
MLNRAFQWLREYWNSYDRTDKAGVFIILFLSLVAPAFGGWDFYTAYRGETLSGQYMYSFNPYPAYWFFYLFAVLPPTLGYILWNLSNAVGFLYALHHWKASPFIFSLSLVCFWTFFSGQMEGLLAGALALAFHPNFWIAGLAISILTFKPQFGIIVILYVILRRRDWRMFILPTVIYLLSFIFRGWWLPEWLAHLRVGYDLIGKHTNISMYPLGLIFLLLLLRYRNSLKIWMLSASLAMPYFPIYSLASFFTLQASPWWVQAAIWAFYLIAAIFKPPEAVLMFSSLIPLTLLGMELWKGRKVELSAIDHS